MAELRAVVSGVVQGVGFRWWTARRCEQLGLDGGGVNQADGTVLVRARGGSDALEQLLGDLREGTAGRPGTVDEVVSQLQG
ncbi:acylphosphatase [Streptomyces sp. NP160]|uniref:acylphosphatase n=1 Tax=Streptomyces sp. NP160 TaxID=2586637 RepID=UPI001C593B5C|nr:acylphosphatase [Streptomyces sp. NP160]